MRKSTLIRFGHKTASFAEACTPSSSSARSSISSTCSFIKYTNMKKNILSCIVAILLLMPAYLVKASSTISSSFNSASISAGKKIWFSAVIKVNGTATYPLTINFTNQTISSSAFSLSVASAQLILDPSVTTATTVYNGSTWVTTAPPNETGNYFISGYRDSLTSTIGGGLGPVSWTGTFSTCGAGVSISWQWAASVYTSFNSDMNSLGIKPSDCGYCSAYYNTDHAGTPEHYKSYAVTGATGSTSGGSCGGGGSTYTTTYSSYQSVSLSGTSFATSVCIGSTTTLTAGTTGGTWSSSNTPIASVSAGGVLTGVGAGTTNIAYSVSGCTVSQAVTVNALPTAGASSNTPICEGSTLNLTSTTGSTSGGSGSGGSCGGSGGSGGSSTFSWHGPSSFSSASQNPNRTAMTTAMVGTYSVTVTDNHGCKATATTEVAVTAAPTVSAVTGTSSICQGTTTTFADATTGGTWSSGSASHATVNASGAVTGVSAGSATISYKIANSCGTAIATKVITVTGAPDAGSITGSGALCTDATINLTHSVAGGVWSASPTSVATVNTSGVVTGVATGTATIAYTVTNSCGTDVATKIVSVSPAPAAGTITGSTSVCAGGTTTLADAATGGTWSVSTTSGWGGGGSHATVSADGVVTGVSVGTSTISYKVTNSCGSATATQTVSINAAPDAGTLSGTTTLCVGATLTVGHTASGGAFSSGAPGIAAVSSAGVVTGVSAGTATISYVVTNACGTASATRGITVNAGPNAGTVTGDDNLCAGATTTFADAVSGGTWSTISGGHATVSASGVVTGVSAGAAIISYKVTNSCGYAVATKMITVAASPDAGTITGAATACAGAAANMTETISGGVWSSGATGIATIDVSGVVTGVSAGTAMISYLVTASCGSAVATRMITITSLPDAGVISGIVNVCESATTTLNNTVNGGAWSTSDGGIATVSSAGVVTGVAAGSATIYYTVANGCGSAAANTSIVVNPLPDAGTITASADICVGATATLNNTVGGGVWSTDAAGIATVDVSGIVTGVGAGVANIYYTIANGCGSATAHSVITVNAAPGAGTITGGNVACMGAALNLTNSVSGGAWSTSNASVATVDASGVVTIVGAGSATIYYTVTNSCGSSVAGNTVAAGSLPDAGVVSGGTAICAGTSTNLNNTVSGGVWSSGAASVATVSASGVVTGVAAGVATISYTVSNSCGSANATGTIIVDPLPATAPVTGSTSVCLSATTILADVAAGGVWSSSNPSVASVDATGSVTGVAAGSAAISYTMTNSCGSVTVTSPMAVNLLPAAGIVSGIDSVCVAVPTLFTDGATGGVWSASPAATAVVDAAGNVTGLTGGLATIAYTVTNGCGTAVASRIIHIKPLPDPGVIIGPSHVAYQSVIVLSDTVGVGAWTASNTYATVVGGIVNGLYPGTVTVTYSLSNMCGSAFTSKMITIDTPIVFVSQITGPAFFACVGSTAAFWNGTTGGLFAINGADTAVATVIPTTGLVTGISAGTATLSYTVWGTTVTSVLTVYPVPAAIAGPGTVCMGASIMLVDPTPGGVWSSSIPSTATISPGGVVTGSNAGVVPMYYTLVAPAGCRSVFNVTVNPNPAGITGASAVCPGATITLHDVTPGGNWNGSNGHANVDAFGNVTGVSAGGIIVSYTAPATGCSATDVITINDGPAPIAGNLNVCTGAVTFLSDASLHPMSWTSGNPSVATITGSGAVSGVSVGTATVSFTLTSGCFITAVVSVNPVPAVAAISGPSSVSLSGGPVTLSDPTDGGIWSSSNTGIMTIGATSGIVTPLWPAGNSTIYYTVTNTFGCVGQAAKLITAGAAPRSHGTTTASVGTAVNVSDENIGGEWNSSDNTVATVDGNGVVTAVAPGNTTITHTVAANGALTETVTQVIVNALPFEVRLFPIPNQGTFNVTGTAGTDKDINVTIEVTNMLGQVVYTSNGTAAGGVINSQVSLGSNLTNGNYVLTARNGNENRTIHFVIEK